MNYKITRLLLPGARVVFYVSGRIEREALVLIEGLLGSERSEVAIDLEEVRLVDRETVTFLAARESSGVELRNCPSYIREWINQERKRG